MFLGEIAHEHKCITNTKFDKENDFVCLHSRCGNMIKMSFIGGHYASRRNAPKIGMPSAWRSAMLRSIAIAVATLMATTPAVAEPNWTGVDKTLGRTGTVQPDGVHKYSFPRSDLNVTLDGVRLKPALALGSWVAFEPMGDTAMVMGDLVLTQEEVNPVMSRLLESGLTITALHNHLLRSAPGTMYMHVHGSGDPTKLATALRSALALSKTPMMQPAASSPPTALALDTARLDKVIGWSGKANGGVYQFSIPRPEHIMDMGMAVPPSMGLAIALNLQPTGAGKAVGTGDFVLLQSEVDPVLRALRSANIDVTALHNHLGQEQPRLFFMHFWANGDATAIASGLRKALDATAVRPK
jgi:hypothetical protein